MISVKEALQILKENLPEPRIVHTPLEEVFGRRLAEDILAPNRRQDIRVQQWTGMPFAGQILPGLARADR